MAKKKENKFGEWNKALDEIDKFYKEKRATKADKCDDFGELNTVSQTFTLDGMINQILWDAQIDDDYLDEARESIKILIEKASQNSR